MTRSLFFLFAFWSCASPINQAQAQSTPRAAPSFQPIKLPEKSLVQAEAEPKLETATSALEKPSTPLEIAAVTKTPSCPSNMVLVSGDYCSKVEHECESEWYDASNKKRICERFLPKARCVGTQTPKRFCIDTYAWPNQKDVRPEVMNRFHQAQVKCAAVGKRLCTESEWTLACEGPKMKPFPYGYVRDSSKCNGDRKWDDPNMDKVAARDPIELGRLWQGVPNGSQPDCVSDFGVYDLPGNTDDIVSSESKGYYDSVHTGGPWYKGVRNQCRPKIYTHNEDFYYYFLGFRCCAEADGKTTDPRTPRQIQEKWNWKRVEQSAQFGVEEMKKKLNEKSEGNCVCAEKDILCKTMCGTLLGPNAQDAKPEERMKSGKY